MAKAPKSPRRSPRRRGATAFQPAATSATPPKKTASEGPPRKKSTAGKVTGAVIGVASAAGVLTGLYQPTAKPALVCGGTDRWQTKVATDADAISGKIDLTTDKLFSVPEINNMVLPSGPFDAAGRMPVELKAYKVKGFLSYFKTESDQDYHVVISDQQGLFAQGNSPAKGQSVVVEFPNPDCFGGKHSTGPATSELGQAIAQARANFEDHVHALGLSHDKVITQPVPVTVTGVAFFDHYASNHAPTGHSIPRELPDGSGQAVLELHPVTDVVFQSDPDPAGS
jgi:hypothetical protein